MTKWVKAGMRTSGTVFKTKKDNILPHHDITTSNIKDDI